MKKIFLVICIMLFNNLCFSYSSEHLFSSSYSSTGFISVSGGKLYYRAMGKGSPIIIIHGGPGLDHTYLLPQLSELQKKHQVIYYDQRSSGKSLPANINNTFMNVDQFVEDIDSIRRSLGYKKITLIGHSWGGMLAMRYSIKFPKHTKALILMNSVPATSIGFNAFLKEFQNRTKPIQDQIDNIIHSQKFIKGETKSFNNYCQLLFTKYLYKESDIHKLLFNFPSETAKNQINIENIFSKSLFETSYDMRPKLKHLKIPTLVIHGDYDPIPLWTAKQISIAIQKSKFVVIKESGHFSYAEKPQKVNSVIKNFMDHL